MFRLPSDGSPRGASQVRRSSLAPSVFKDQLASAGAAPHWVANEDIVYQISRWRARGKMKKNKKSFPHAPTGLKRPSPRPLRHASPASYCTIQKTFCSLCNGRGRESHPLPTAEPYYQSISITIVLLAVLHVDFAGTVHHANPVIVPRVGRGRIIVVIRVIGRYELCNRTPRKGGGRAAVDCIARRREKGTTIGSETCPIEGNVTACSRRTCRRRNVSTSETVV